MEQEAIDAIEWYIKGVRLKRKTTGILFAQKFAKFPDEVFVWSRDREELVQLATKHRYMQARKLRCVTGEEWHQLLSTIDKVFEVRIPSWVRIKGGLYNGDLALVEQSYSTGDLDVLLVPRIRTKDNRRPTAMCLTQSMAVEKYGRRSVKDHATEPQWFTVRKMLIKNGLHSLFIQRTKVSTSAPKSIAEITPFVGYATSSGNTLHFKYIAGVMEDIKTRDLVTSFRPHDRIKINDGPFIGMHGRVDQIFEPDEHATVDLVVQEGLTRRENVPLRHLSRVFRVGDSVRVLWGLERGRRGVITRVDGPILNFIETDGDGRSAPPDGSGIQELGRLIMEVSVGHVFHLRSFTEHYPGRRV